MISQYRCLELKLIFYLHIPWESHSLFQEKKASKESQILGKSNVDSYNFVVYKCFVFIIFYQL